MRVPFCVCAKRKAGAKRRMNEQHLLARVREESCNGNLSISNCYNISIDEQPADFPLLLVMEHSRYREPRDFLAAAYRKVRGYPPPLHSNQHTMNGGD